MIADRAVSNRCLLSGLVTAGPFHSWPERIEMEAETSSSDSEEHVDFQWEIPCSLLQGSSID